MLSSAVGTYYDDVTVRTYADSYRRLDQENLDISTHSSLLRGFGVKDFKIVECQQILKTRLNGTGRCLLSLVFQMIVSLPDLEVGRTLFAVMNRLVRL